MTFNTQEEGRRERAVLAGVDTGEYDMAISMEELRELADSAELDVVGIATQVRGELEPGTCMGLGRLRELAEQVLAGENGTLGSLRREELLELLADTP